MDGMSSCRLPPGTPFSMANPVLMMDAVLLVALAVQPAHTLQPLHATGVWAGAGDGAAQGCAGGSMQLSELLPTLCFTQLALGYPALVSWAK